MKPEVPHNEQRSSSKTWLTDLIGIGLLGLFLVLFFNYDRFSSGDWIRVPDSWLTVNTLFLSVVIEAVPFILIGVLISSMIQVYVPDDTLQRFLPKNAYAALVPASLLGAILPICECAIIPVVRRLIKKGMPVHVGIVFLVAAPILNPIVFASTFFAFRTSPEVIYSRMGLAFVLSIIIGAILYGFFRKTDVLREKKDDRHSHGRHEHTHIHADGDGRAKPVRKWKQTVYHTIDEFFYMGKFLIIGAFIAAVIQTFLDRQVLLKIGTNEWSSTMVMMALAYVLSLCSEADAFVAASFGNTFTTGSIIAFLVYGPMLDLKNTIMLFAYFKWRFAIAFMATVSIVVFAAVMALQFFALN